jgi:Transglycosylase SLT domain
MASTNTPFSQPDLLIDRLQVLDTAVAQSNQALCKEAVCGLTDPSFKARCAAGRSESSSLPQVALTQFAEGKSPVDTKAPPAVAGDATDREDKADKLSDKVAPSSRITMAMQELGDKPLALPKVLIKANGRIEYSGDIDSLLAKPGAEILVELERRQGQLNPTDKQFKAAQLLTEKLAGQIHHIQGAVTITIDDRDNIVKSDEKICLGLRSAEVLRTSDQTADIISTLHRSKGIDGMDMPRAQTRDFALFETRSVRKLPHETYQDMAQKEAVAALFQPDKNKPYETARVHPNGDIRVGRYGFSGKQIGSFVDGLGEPPQHSHMQDLVKQGRLSPDYAEKLMHPEFRERVKGLAQDLQRGVYPESAVLRELLPKQAQEQIALRLLDAYRYNGISNEGQLAAVMLSGRSTETPDEIVSGEPKALAEAGQKLYRMARAWQVSEQWKSDNPNKIQVDARPELIETALMLAKVPVTDANIKAVDLIVRHESSWNPKAVNNWDLNARNNNHSKGLMQTIASTFRKHAVAGHDDIFNPVDNMAAGIRYAMMRYGSLDEVPGVKAKQRGHNYKGF